MVLCDTTVDEWLEVIRGEFLEMPGLVLSRSQFKRLWGLDDGTCDAAIDALVKSRFLLRRADGTYARTQSAA
jgi:hypothetical protein